jgi:glycosyltransferase involved in cell wall biosynthesis
MLQGILEGGAEGEHELEPVFFQDGAWPAELRSAGLRVEVIDAGRLRQAGRYVRTVRALAALFRERHPDVILNWSAKTQLYGSPAAVLAGQSERVVWWQQAIPRRTTGVDIAATLLPAGAVGCYSGAAERAQQRMWPRRRTFVVAAGTPVPDPSIGPAATELPEGVPIVGLVGRLQPWKGQDRLLRAQRMLLDRGVRMHTLIVGGDSYGLSPEYAASLAPLARELGIDGDVTMTGEVPDAGPYIQRMDVLVNASDPEPFGIVILEGMAQGVAVVAVNSGGPAEFVDDGVTGLLARSGSAEALADALQELLTRPELRAQIARQGRERFEVEYTTEALRRRFFARLQEVLDARGTSSTTADRS